MLRTDRLHVRYRTKPAIIRILGTPNKNSYQVILTIQLNINEYKGKWTLNPDWFQAGGRIDGHNLNAHIQGAINQIYSYLVENRLEYGTLTSFESTFFLKRVKIDNANDGFEQLVISSCISHDSVSPTILQSIAYFMSIANGNQISPPPPRAAPTLRSSSRPLSIADGSRISLPSRRATPTLGNSNMSSSSITHPNFSSHNFSSGSDFDQEPRASPSSYSSGSNFNRDHVEKGVSYCKEVGSCLEDLEIKYVLGCGRAKVYYEAKNHLALKAIDLFKHADMMPEMENEIEIYEHLIDLQGVMIPKLLLHGYWRGGMYCIGLSLCGRVPETLSDSQKRKVIESLDAIHSYGILHNDIKKENILVDEDGSVWLIDFGFATRNDCTTAQEEEKAWLRECIRFL